MTSLLDGSETPEQIESYHKLLVGPEAKFKTDEELAKGKYEADRYAKTLERQMDELRQMFIKEREENTSRAKLQELIDQMKVQQQPSSEQPQQTESREKPLALTDNVSRADIESLVSHKIKEDKEAARRDANFNQVKAKLTERYGPQFQTALEQQIQALDLTIDEANELARTRPQVFIKTFGLDQPQIRENFQSPPRTNLQSSAFKPTVEKRDWEYYQKMKMEDPVRYAHPSTNVQMHKDAMEQGESFMTGDFNKDDKELVRELGMRRIPPSPVKGWNPFEERDNRSARR